MAAAPRRLAPTNAALRMIFLKFTFFSLLRRFRFARNRRRQFSIGSNLVPLSKRASQDYHKPNSIADARRSKQREMGIIGSPENNAAHLDANSREFAA